MYSLDLANDDYDVSLYFAETYDGAFSEGGRVFDVLIDGILVVNNLDIFSEVGSNAALVKSFTTTISDGQINIEFLHDVENPKISAIEIVPSASSICGPADEDESGVIEIEELNVFVFRWKTNSGISLRELMVAIGEWKNGC